MYYQKDVSKLCPPRLASAIFAALILASSLSIASGPKASPGKWMKELAGTDESRFTGYSLALGWRAEHLSSYPGPFLVVGIRPPLDKPASGIKLFGTKQSDTDWVVADSSGALWVTGLLPAPEPGEAVVFSGRLLSTNATLAIQGFRILIAGVQKGKTHAKPGDFVYFPLAGNKSSTCPVEIDGDAAEIAFTDERDTLILRAVKPGTVKIRVFSLWFGGNNPTQTDELLLQVR